MSTSIGLASRNVALDAALDVLNGGYLRIYSGTIPANADAVLVGATLLAELRFGTPAFGAASNGQKVANAITPAQSVLVAGTAAFFRAYKSDGTTVVVQGLVGTSGADCNLSKVTLITADQVRVTSMVLSS